MNQNIINELNFRSIDKKNNNEIETVIKMEQDAFPPNEVCQPQHMRERINVADNLFLIGLYENEIVSYINGIATNENKFRDEFFTDSTLHIKNGKNIMMLGVVVKKEYEGIGIARQMMEQYKNRSKISRHEKLILTCLPRLVAFYNKLGFTDIGISNSVWGGEMWHDMCFKL